MCLLFPKNVSHPDLDAEKRSQIIERLGEALTSVSRRRGYYIRYETVTILYSLDWNARCKNATNCKDSYCGVQRSFKWSEIE